MLQKFTKQDYINEILRLTKNLCQMTHDSKSDKQIKKLIQENFAAISELDKQKELKKQKKAEENLSAKLKFCAR